MRTRSTALLSAVLLLVLVSDVEAQQTGSGQTQCVEDERSVARVTGRLIAQDDSLNLSRGMILQLERQGGWCFVSATADGEFEFRGLSAGRYLLHVRGTLGLAPVTPISFVVDTDTLLRLDVPVYPDNRIRECLETAPCASILTRRTAAETASSEERRLYLLGYRLTVALAGEGWEQAEPWLLCIEDSTDVVEALREVYPETVPKSECQIQPIQMPGSRFPRRLLRHVPTQRPARWAHPPVVEDVTTESARIRTGYTVGGLWGQGNLCELLRLEGAWVVNACLMTWIS